ncbi:hypothetical protein RFI_39804 [Reticulomyxa filosa]|uniref:Uncharacterized protein n=1 Tax=Reticulomyxa filosa TaxID=46433 RepID=X6L7F3_RETFI|nr:hypothetical protein RFI_39804 [Reticulomyxa filosa]|eukprot:ETN97722.1 hypothetical protein RFI_39804 [Reticulomyxa filosa]
MYNTSNTMIHYQNMEASRTRQTRLQLQYLGLGVVDDKLYYRKEVPKHWDLQITIKNMASQLRPVADTLQQLLNVRQDHSILQERGILKLTKELMTMITDFENFAQLDEHNEDNIATKRHHELAPSHIFSNELVNSSYFV